MSHTPGRIRIGRAPMARALGQQDRNNLMVANAGDEADFDGFTANLIYCEAHSKLGCDISSILAGKQEIER